MIARALEAEIVRLHHTEHWPIGTIAAQLRVHHGTVRRVLAQAGMPVATSAARASIVEPYRAFIVETLTKYPTLRASRLYHMVRERGYQRIRFGHLPGVDVKAPWELARMPHLPVLALAYAAALSGSLGFAPPETYLREFRNQVLDFIATNPPRYGVNWACPMEVAIRAVNWLLAFDLFRAHDACFDTEFEHELARSVRAHGAHIFGNLEWQPVIRGNHYLADLGGLLFAGAYLPADDETDAWLALGLAELPREIDYQFQEDGTSFEGSTCYHRLSAEIVAYSLAVALGLPAERLARLPSNAPGARGARQANGLVSGIRDPRLGRRLSEIADFLLAIARPDGRMPQLGDNDSGRFVRLLPSISRQRNPVDDDLDPRPTVAALTALLAGSNSKEAGGPYGLESAIVQSLASGPTVGGLIDCNARTRLGTSGEHSSQRFFPDFGVYVYRRTGWYLCVRCGPNGNCLNPPVISRTARKT